jgi:DNA-binding transcriptional LysR family regulator
MNRLDWPDLAAFAAIAEERSFTRAAARLGVSVSSLSHGMRGLEERLGVRLLARTTRSVAPTEAGQRLLLKLKPAMEDVREALEDLTHLRDRPAGLVRLTALRMAAVHVIAPRLKAFNEAYPDVTLEIAADDGLADIVAAGFDAGVRLGEQVARDMISVPVSGELRAVVVGSPNYFSRFPPPQTPHDLARHRCLNIRMITAGRLYRWEFEKDGRELAVAVEGPLIANDFDLTLRAALDGVGLSYAFEEQARPYLESGALVRVLEDWCEPFPGAFLYYPSRRQVTPALRALIDTLRVG